MIMIFHNYLLDNNDGVLVGVVVPVIDTVLLEALEHGTASKMGL